MAYRSNPRSFDIVPDLSNGYFIEDGKGWIGIIKPETGRNDITNPSFERNTTGWTASNSTIVRSVTQQYRGIYSLKVTPTNGNAAGVVCAIAGISTTVPNTMSVYLFGHPGDTYQLYAGSAFGTRSVASQLREVVGSGRWQRLVITCHAGGNMIVARKSGGTTNPFYLDCAQSEEKAYVTTYMDGDETGMLPYVQSYYWGGLSHSSKSYRLANGNGGREMNLLDLGFRLMAIVGLGMLPIVNASLPYANGGGIYQRSIYQARGFSLAGAITATGLSELQKQRAALVELCSPFNLGEQQPLLMKYHVLDDDGQDALVGNIECAYESGLEGALDNYHQERVGITFRQFMPLIVNDQAQTEPYVKPAYFDAIEEIVVMNRYGEFSQLSPGVPVDILANVFNFSKEGYLFLGGTVTPYLYQWDGASYTIPDSKSPNGAVLAIAKRYAGGVWVGGNFGGGITGVANTNYVAMWDGSAWHALGGGGVNHQVNSIIEDPDTNIVYIGGAFDTAGGAANTTRIASYSEFSGWDGLKDGVDDGSVLVMALAADGTLYVGGTFSAVDSGAPYTAYIAYYDTINDAWGPVGQAPYGATNGAVTAMVIGADGNLYVGGAFTTIGGVACPGGFAMWNGASWTDLGAPTYLADPITSLVALPTGEILMGVIPTYGGSIGETNYVIYNNGQYHPGLSNAIASTSLAYGPRWLNPATGEVYFGQEIQPGSNFFYIANPTYTINNPSPINASPKLYIQGPITRLSGIVNQTNGTRIYFKTEVPFQVFQDEIVIISTGQTSFSVRSELRGDLSAYILPDSTAAFYLSPGDNILSIGGLTNPIVSGSAVIMTTNVHISGATNENTDGGRLYATWTKPGATEVLKLYKDAAKTQLVAETTAAPSAPILEVGGSGISGVLTSVGYVSDETSITIDVPLVFITYQETYLAVDQMRP